MPTMSPSREKGKNNMLFLEQIQLIRFHKQLEPDNEAEATEEKPDSTRSPMTMR